MPTNGQRSALWYHSIIIRKPEGCPDDVFLDPSVHTGITQYLTAHPNIKDWVCQTERGKTQQRLHIQVYLQLLDKKRCGTVYNELADVWPTCSVQPCSTAGVGALKHYCMKEETRVAGPWGARPIYTGEDLGPITTDPFLWTQHALAHLKTRPRYRAKIHVLFGPEGNIGKSLFTKYACWHKLAKRIPLGSATQLKTNVCSRGAARAYMLDLPRVLGKEERLRDVFSAIEEIANGFVSSAMNGKDWELFMNPPHVFVFTNMDASVFQNANLLSYDKWHFIDVENYTDNVNLNQDSLF